MVNNSTNINKTNNYNSTQLIEHKEDHAIYRWKSPCPGLRRTQTCGRVKSVKWDPNPTTHNMISKAYPGSI